MKRVRYNDLEFGVDIDINRVFLSREIKGKKVLIVGGAGSIGSSYTKEILKFEPSKLVIVDNNENALTELTRDLRSSNLLDYEPLYITYPVDLLSRVFDKVFLSDDWHIVANFSAHKHVRSEKDPISVEALINNNVFGAIKLLDLCEACSPNYFFSVSTDKAANPVNIMGASKSLMEKLIIARKEKFRVSTARFANVAFSNGSLLDGFVRRLDKMQPLSCPDDIRRFFVTPEQSGQICLLATFLGDSGSIFFPKLDEQKDQIYFKDIALEFLEEKGFDAVIVESEREAKVFPVSASSRKYPVYFFPTDTSGEKSFEQFYTKQEDYYMGEYHSLGVIKKGSVEISSREIADEFQKLFARPDLKKLDIVETLKKHLPDFEHIETGRNLDQKM